MLTVASMWCRDPKSRIWLLHTCTFQIDYSECLSDKQWSKAIEEGRLEDVDDKQRRKRKRKDNGGMYYEGEFCKC